MIDESSRRRADFDPETSRPVRMGDGQEWWFPRPFVRVWMPPERAVATTTAVLFTDDPIFRSKRQAVRNASPREILGAIAGLTAFLLGLRYVLSARDLCEVLHLLPDDTWPREVIEVCDGIGAPRSWERWQRLSLMAQGAPPPAVLLEDATDLVDFLEATGRTVPRSKWAVESIAATANRANDAYI